MSEERFSGYLHKLILSHRDRLCRRYNLNDKECEIWDEGLATRTIAKKCKCMLKIYMRCCVHDARGTR